MEDAAAETDEDDEADDPPDDDTESLVNGASARLWVFAGACLLCWVGTLAMPRLVDGPRRSALLAAGSGTRSDEEVAK